jgi:hypothetical protein
MILYGILLTKFMTITHQLLCRVYEIFIGVFFIVCEVCTILHLLGILDCYHQLIDVGIVWVILHHDIRISLMLHRRVSL